MIRRKLKTLAACAIACVLILSPGSASADAKGSCIASWNVYSKQFIDAPVFRLLPIPGAVEYRAAVKQGGKTWTVRSKTPILDLTKIWRKLDAKKFSLSLDWVGADGKLIHTETSERVKAPDFAGFREPAADWVAAANRNVTYLIDAAEHAPAPHREPGVPVWIWSACPNYNLGYPCITIPPLTWALLAYAKVGGPQGAEALALARAGADWMLAHRQADSGALPLFPHTTVTMGKYNGGAEPSSINLLRASWLGQSFVDLYAATRHEPYLAYARHIADVTVKFQNGDGSFPYRVDPKTGAVVEQYGCGAMDFVELAEKLAPYGFDERRALAARRALDWMLAYPSVSGNWKATYEDAADQPIYTNLSQMSVLPLISYLCRHKSEDPAYLPMAVRLNRWVEDQFVMFGSEDEASGVRAKGPLVFEQFICYWPMEFHTANWILALIELHKATGKKVYLDKAKAAANAICAAQYPNGDFSTWGRDERTGTSVMDTSPIKNWYNCNAMADEGIYALTRYVKSLKR